MRLRQSRLSHLLRHILTHRAALDCIIRVEDTARLQLGHEILDNIIKRLRNAGITQIELKFKFDTKFDCELDFELILTFE
jgi:divalent metal cation (Fe/Co/Zn/Cd) transporter